MGALRAAQGGVCGTSSEGPYPVMEAGQPSGGIRRRGGQRTVS